MGDIAGNQTVQVNIYLMLPRGKCEQYAFRRWRHIPRVGDTVELRNSVGTAVAVSWRLATVVEVRWGGRDGPIAGEDQQAVALFVRWKKPQGN